MRAAQKLPMLNCLADAAAAGQEEAVVRLARQLGLTDREDDWVMAAKAEAERISMLDTLSAADRTTAAGVHDKLAGVLAREVGDFLHLQFDN